jgi:small subunit ribosomal protein S3
VGQKTHPIGFRLGVVKTWNSRWYAEKNFADLLYEDMMIRRYLRKRLGHASLSNVGIERTVREVTINLFTARPGIVIGKKGEEVERLRGEMQHLTGKQIYINIREIKRPEVDAQLVGENIARQLEKRVAFRRAMKKAVASAMRLGAQGIKITCSGKDAFLCRRCAPTSTTRPRARKRPTARSASRSGSSRAKSSRRTH